MNFRNSFSAVGCKYLYCSSVILSASLNFLMMDTNCLLYFCVGFFFSFSYVLSSDNTVLTFYSYSSVSIITIAFPLSGGRIIVLFVFALLVLVSLSCLF